MDDNTKAMSGRKLKSLRVQFMSGSGVSWSDSENASDRSNVEAHESISKPSLPRKMTVSAGFIDPERNAAKADPTKVEIRLL